MLYSKYELEVVVRTINSSSDAALEDEWTGPASYISQEPSEAYMYLAAMLTMPRTTLVHSWFYGNSRAFKLAQETEVDILAALDKVSFRSLGRVLRSSGLLQRIPSLTQRIPSLTTKDSKASGASAGKLASASSGSLGGAAEGGLSSGKVALGVWLWPVTLLSPGVVICFLALAAAEASPLAAGWVLLAGLFRMSCELRILLHCLSLVWRRRPQAAVQCLGCSHGVPFMLGCHAMLLLRLAMALLPARAFFIVSFYLYGTWAPLASSAIMLFAMQPQRGAPLQDAVDNILHLGHRAVADLQPHGAGEALHEGPTVTLRFRKHWPPPVKVPADLQEDSEHAPKHVLCPITHHILTEPAVTSTGATYERAAIIEWLSKAGKDPLTGHTITVDEVFPNLVMYSVVEEYVREATAARTAAERSSCA